MRRPEKAKYCAHMLDNTERKTLEIAHQGEEERRDQIFQLLHHGDSKPIVVGYDKTGQETTCESLSELAVS